ncbi:MAG TPA: hypothetical protein DC049_01720, partial [Spirochaetia bacterium]|nr:hypothetical protein [Spirochaetia bacterium]
MKYKNKNIKDVTLEMSLKPFKKTDKKYIEQVITEMFRQWDALTRYADQISILLWTSDGSQILDYTGNMNEEMEWARYIGGANPRRKIPGDPEGIGLHSRFHNYIDNPPVITYKTLRSIIECLKKTGKKITGKPIRVGETFDPGPEFAKSSFKYERHNEVCRGGTMGDKSFICCYADLNGDNRRYAGFPNGIPDKTPFGVFLGRQCAHYLKDLGFDYIWFSNGFGFGVETWGATGSVFNGETFDVLAIEESKDKMLIFWRAFFKECPGLAVETRGTNLSTGMDLSSDAAPVKQIYEQFDITPPPNSPWAALNGDFGLELIGYMSHIAELPGKDYRFRFYIHDPWWNNSPWLDRYMRKAHDIYLPLSVGRINENSVIENPSLINILTVDDSFGNMPVECPNETIPHILRGYEEFPDVPGPFVWVYPFDEYHDLTFSKPERISEVFFGDWFIRDAVNNGLPLNTVASGRIFKTTMENNPAFYQDRIIVTIVPEAESSLEASIFTFLGQGGKVLLYGPLTHASQRLLDLLGMEISTPLSGTMEIEHKITEDIVESGVYPRQIEH